VINLTLSAADKIEGLLAYIEQRCDQLDEHEIVAFASAELPYGRGYIHCAFDSDLINAKQAHEYRWQLYEILAQALEK